jgi:hypothetical protein
MKQITLYTASTHFPFLVSNLVRAMMEKQLLTSGQRFESRKILFPLLNDTEQSFSGYKREYFKTSLTVVVNMEYLFL